MKIKAWYVDLRLARNPIFSGERWGKRARIFRTIKEAEEAFTKPLIVLPCEINIKGLKRRK